MDESKTHHKEKQAIKVYMIAGEASGDALGKSIIEDIKRQAKDVKDIKNVEFMGVGGQLMQEAGGFKSLFDINELSVIGVFEVLKKLPRLLKLIKKTIEDIKKAKPDIVITIDVPDFSFRIAKALHKNDQTKNIKLVHTVAPTVWAWRAGRAKKIAKIYDHLFTLFDFEPPYFEKHGLHATFIGHPAAQGIEKELSNKEKINSFSKKYQKLKDGNYITILPGSRKSEVDSLLPKFIDAINLFKASNNNDNDNNKDDLKLAIVVAPTVKDQVMKKIDESNLCDDFIIVDPDYKYICFNKSKAAIAAAGTISLELGLCGTPTVVAYILNPLSYFLARLLIKVKYASLPNIILGKEIFKELFQGKCNPQEIATNLEYVINHCDEIKKDLMDLSTRFNNSKSSGKVIIDMIRKS